MRVCIVCQKELDSGSGPTAPAAPVREDPVIRIIRQIKQKLGVARNNDLYVCAQDYAAHIQRRKNFEKNMIISTVLASGLILLLIGLPLLAGRIDVGSILGSVFIGFLIVLAVVFFSYTAAVEPMELAVPAPAFAPAAPASAATSSTSAPSIPRSASSRSIAGSALAKQTAGKQTKQTSGKRKGETYAR